MGYPLKINGQVIEFPNKADADAFLVKQLLAPAPISGGRKANGEAFPVHASSAKMVAEFLKTLGDGGSRGVDTARVMRAVGITHHQAFGNRGKNINKLLVKLGFEPHDIYTNARNERGDREWKPGPRMAEAVEAVKKYLGGN